MKKIYSCILILLFILGMASCGNTAATLPVPVTKMTAEEDNTITILDEEVPLHTAPSDFTPHPYAQEVLELVNEERAAADLVPLFLNPRLCEAAQLRAEESVKSFSHTRPDGSLCFSVLEEYGISHQNAAENIAGKIKSPEKVVSAWMGSPAHRTNIMSEAYTELGIGYTEGGYWTQLFIG